MFDTPSVLSKAVYSTMGSHSQWPKRLGSFGEGLHFISLSCLSDTLIPGLWPRWGFRVGLRLLAWVNSSWTNAISFTSCNCLSAYLVPGTASTRLCASPGDRVVTKQHGLCPHGTRCLRKYRSHHTVTTMCSYQDTQSLETSYSRDLTWFAQSSLLQVRPLPACADITCSWSHTSWCLPSLIGSGVGRWAQAASAHEHWAVLPFQPALPGGHGEALPWRGVTVTAENA